MNTIDLLNLGVDPDDLLPDPTRCHGPAYPDSHGCGRFARGGMCERCQEETQAYWAIDVTNQIAHERAMAAREAAWYAQQAGQPVDCVPEDLPF